MVNVIPASIDDFSNLIALVDRHDCKSFIVIRGVERDRQIDLSLLVSETPDLWNQTHSRDGEAASPKVVAIRIAESVNRRHGIVVVVERLAHPHKDDVRYYFVHILQHLRVIHDLCHDLAARKMTFETHLPGGAKDTTHRAPCLRRNTKRTTIFCAT